MQEVVAGILFDKSGRVLVSSRPEGKSFAHYWEFPGGKVEKGEMLLEALFREFSEELNLRVQTENWQLFWQMENQATIKLSFFICKTHFNYKVEPLEGQLFRWLRKDEMADVLFLPSNSDVLSLLKEDKYQGFWQDLCDKEGGL